MNDGFYDARTAREIAFGGGASNLVILGEINALRLKIATAAADGDLTVTVTNETTMTQYDTYNGSGTSSYYDAFMGLNADNNTVKKSKAQMNSVMNYFVKLGYTLNREKNGNTTRINWVISW